jgi:hypothetical protein
MRSSALSGSLNKLAGQLLPFLMDHWRLPVAITTLLLTLISTYATARESTGQVFVQPQISIRATTTRGVAPLNVGFTALPRGILPPDCERHALKWTFTGATTTSTAEGRTVNHTFEVPGEYTVHITYTPYRLAQNECMPDGQAFNSNIKIFVDAPQQPSSKLVACISPPQATITAGESVTFDSRCSQAGEDAQFVWTVFGENQPVQARSFTRTFPIPGTFTIVLDVSAPGQVSHRTRARLLVQDVPLRPCFTWSPQSPMVGEPATFTADCSELSRNPSSKNVQYQWRFRRRASYLRCLWLGRS